MDFMKKYIHIAKLITPDMTNEASQEIAEAYTRLRSMNLDDAHMARTQPITARSLETLIRLATAQARARMSRTVSKKDAQEAIALLEFACFKRVLEKEKKKRPRVTDDGDVSGSEDEGMGEDEEGPAPEDGDENGQRRSSKRLRQEDTEEDEVMLSEDEASDPAGEEATTPEADSEMEVDTDKRVITDER